MLRKQSTMTKERGRTKKQNKTKWQSPEKVVMFKKFKYHLQSLTLPMRVECADIKKNGPVLKDRSIHRIGDNVIPAFRFYRSAQPRFPLEALSEAASALNADNSDIKDDVAETTSADIGDCDLWVPEDEKEDEENEEEDEENVENKISDSEIETSGNSRRTNKAISNLKCKK
ncbi:hypothetical protein FQA39_LY16475 [Lamprigera yunnana]|nr:hypothetical protein FQA39_LY16475 [Lamprigera yunnana]